MAGILVGLVTFLINRLTILRIIKIIGRDLKNIAEGQSDLTRTIDIDSNDEIGLLAFWFNAFIQQLDTMVGNTKKLAGTMRESGIEFNINLRHAGDILQAVFTNLDSIDRLSNSQDQTVKNAKENLSRFIDNIAKISDHSTHLSDDFKDFTHYTQKQVSLTQEFLGSVNNLKHALGDNNNSRTADRNDSNGDLLGATTQFAKESTRSIDEQAQRFTHIEKLLEEIEDIAESTHLLSINASIEAARAGESGRGFTIVALQIRNLATNSGTLTSEIREQIEAIMNVTKNSGAQLIDLRSVLNTHMEDVVTDMQRLIVSAKDISKTVEIISSMQHRLKERVEDIGNGFAEANVLRETLLQPMTELHNYTEKLCESVNHISMGSDEIEKVTKNFIAQGAATEEQAQNLVRSMRDYRTSFDKTRSTDNFQNLGSTVAESNLGGTGGGETFA
ncbi:methyl-accepting chemotaxis protein [Candidatus Haliotispira prima]|uniref:Methyl-accepting chemotaxis protein n=1 Tax=Candidatus Haliotispira prima TaxID=3034016 RepID=A0ABY8MKU0_9SPIO|nr:methyl-accepting chemotaxis protein [Candidatus Haliotispira prima]